ncbi:MAG: carboxypeptidase-like regulatory domain-containing protein [Candidatus Sulfotelmatobacter sp.]
MKRTRKLTLATLLITVSLIGGVYAQKDKDDEASAALNFLVIKEDNGKPVRNAAVILHPVTTHGKQARGGFELKTDLDGKTNFDGVPYGKLRVQVLASGFQTFGEDYDVDHPKMEFTIKLKRPQDQYSIYGDAPNQKKDSKPPPDPNAKPQ